MRWLRLFLFSSLLLGASTARAQIDPDLDGVGIYTDLGATTNSLYQAPGVPFTLHVVLTRPSLQAFPGTLCGCSFSLGLPPNLVVGDWEYAGGHFNAAAPPQFNLVTVIINGVLLTPTTRLLTLHDVVVLDTQPARLYIRGLNGGAGDLAYSSCWTFGELGAAMRPSSGSIDQPVFVVNGEAPVTTESESWSAVKALYR